MRKKLSPIKGVYRIQEKGNWQFQWVIPKDVADAFPTVKYVRESLGTGDLAQANAKAIERIAALEARAAKARAALQADKEQDAAEIGFYDETMRQLGKLLRNPNQNNQHEFIKKTTVAAIRAKQQTVEDVIKEIDHITDVVRKLNTQSLALKDALKELQATDVEVDTGVVTVSSVLNRNLEQIKREDKARHTFEKAFRIAFEVIPDKDVKTVDKADARKIRDAIQSQGVADGTKRNYLAKIKAVFAWAVDEGYCETNPFDGINLNIVVTQSVRNPVATDVLNKVIAHAINGNDYEKLILPLLLTSGARREEICGLSVDDVVINGDSCIIKIRPNRHRTIKNNNSVRDVPIATVVANDLGFIDYCKRRLAEVGSSGLLFQLPKYDGDYGEGYARRVFKPLLKSAGVEPFDIHSLRHTFVSVAATVYPDAELRELITGHKTSASAVASVYLKGYDLARAQEMVDAVAARFDWKGQE